MKEETKKFVEALCAMTETLLTILRTARQSGATVEEAGEIMLTYLRWMKESSEDS